MEGRKRWIRIIVTIIAIFVILFFVGLIAYGNSTSNDKVSVALAGIAALIALGQWFYPLSPGKSKHFKLLHARELVRESFSMGDNAAANFPYITAPIQEVYDTAKKVLIENSKGVGDKRGILILGDSNAGKTRLAFEVLINSLPDWHVLRWKPESKVNEMPQSKKRLVIFIDNLQDYTSAPMKDDERSLTADLGTTSLQTFLEMLHLGVKRVVVATCRSEGEMQVRAGLGQLFYELEVLQIPNFVDDPKKDQDRIIEEFKKYGSKYFKDWDGTLGSLVLGLSKKNTEYLKIKNSSSATILKAMKLLWEAGIVVHTEQRLKAVCDKIFSKEVVSRWREAVDYLAVKQFISEELDEDSKAVLVIRKDTYFDKVITDLQAPNTLHPLDRYFESLKDAFVSIEDANALISLGTALTSRKKYIEAVKVYEQATKFDSQNVHAYFRRGNVLSELKRYEDAIAAYEKAIQFDPNYAYAYNNKGDAQTYLKLYEEALDSFDKAVRLDPGTFVIYQNKGNILSLLKRYEEALGTYNQALLLSPDNADAYLGQANTLAALNHYEIALVVYEKAIKLEPDAAAPFVGKGNALNKLKLYEKALEAFQQAIDLEPDNALAFNGKGSTLANLKRYTQALETFEHVIKLVPGSASAYLGRGNILNEFKRYREALDVYGQATRLDPTNALAYYYQGNILLNEFKRYEEALEAFNQVIQLEPGNALAYNYKGEALAKLDQFDEALAEYKQAGILGMNSTRLYSNVGDALVNREKYEEALVVYTQVIRLEPTNVAYECLGYILVKLNINDKALAAYEQAIILGMNSATIYNDKGDVLLKLNKYAEALAAYEQAIQREPDNALAYNGKGKALEKLNNDIEALEAYKIALSYDRSNAALDNSKNLLRKLYE